MTASKGSAKSIVVRASSGGEMQAKPSRSGVTSFRLLPGGTE